jgi:ABC-type Zn uptake system ZnuABC Zn-binding protein ZnuA
VSLAIRYAELSRDKLAEVDAENAATYRANTTSYIELLERLDDAMAKAIDTIPPQDRKLLTYHDSFPFFSRRYGIEVIGAIQPSDFSEPSGQDVARLIDQIRAEDVPAIFGSEVFPSAVLEQIARETGARYESSLRDDDLPGDPGDPEHSYVGMMLYDVRTIVSGLGGDPSALDSVPLEPE